MEVDLTGAVESYRQPISPKITPDTLKLLNDRQPSKPRRGDEDEDDDTLDMMSVAMVRK